MNLLDSALRRIRTQISLPLWGIALVWLAGTATILSAGSTEDAIVTHWANGHMMDSPSLLPAFARAFNDQDRKTESGQQIRVQLYRANSGEISGEIKARLAHSA